MGVPKAEIVKHDSLLRNPISYSEEFVLWSTEQIMFIKLHRQNKISIAIRTKLKTTKKKRKL